MTAATTKAHLAEAKLVDQLGRLRAAGPESGLVRIVGRFPDGAELAEALDEVAASRTRGRSLPELD